MIELTIDSVTVKVPEGTTLIEAAAQVGIEIPVLCHDDRLDPVGVCRMCTVDVGERALAAACVRVCEDGMEVKTATDEIERHRGNLVDLLMADQPEPEADPRGPVLAGHIHPVVRMRAGSESLRLPVFWNHSSGLMLPAFCSFAGGGRIEPAAGDRLFVVAEGEVIEAHLGASTAG